jgi:hypothetical protein
MLDLANPQFGQASLAEYQRLEMILIAEMISHIYSKIRLASCWVVLFFDISLNLVATVAWE